MPHPLTAPTRAGAHRQRPVVAQRPLPHPHPVGPAVASLILSAIALVAGVVALVTVLQPAGPAPASQPVAATPSTSIAPPAETSRPDPTLHARVDQPRVSRARQQTVRVIVAATSAHGRVTVTFTRAAREITKSWPVTQPILVQQVTLPAGRWAYAVHRRNGLSPRLGAIVVRRLEPARGRG